MHVKIISEKPHHESSSDNKNRRRLAFNHSPFKPHARRHETQHHHQVKHSHRARSRSPVRPRSPQTHRRRRHRSRSVEYTKKRASKPSKLVKSIVVTKNPNYRMKPEQKPPPTSTSTPAGTFTPSHQPPSSPARSRTVDLSTYLPNSPVFLPTPDPKPQPPLTQRQDHDENPVENNYPPKPTTPHPPKPEIIHAPTSPAALIEIPELMGDFDEIHLDHQKQCHLLYHLLQATKGINRSVYLKFAGLLKSEGFIKQDH